MKVVDFLKSNVGLVLSLIALSSSAVGGVMWVDGRYAKASAVEELEERVTLAELKDQLRTATEEYFFLRQQARKYPDDQEIQDELEDAKELVDSLKKQIEENTSN